MIIINCEQGSPEWYEARIGLPTASNFDKLITSKGEPSKQSQAYLYQLAGERIAGAKIETYQSAAMQRGIELEAEARSLFEMLKDTEVHQVGLCLDDSRLYGCSPDGLLESEGLEIKCPLIHTHVAYLLDGKLPADYRRQVQGSLLVTGLERWNFMSYYPGLPPLLVRVERDETFIGKLRSILKSFTLELDEITEKLRGMI